jgi:hypothetical protein
MKPDLHSCSIASLPPNEKNGKYGSVKSEKHLLSAVTP